MDRRWNPWPFRWLKWWTRRAQRDTSIYQSATKINSKSINTGPPTNVEIRSTLMNLKNDKASIWNIQAVPTSWGHSKLIALWKGGKFLIKPRNLLSCYLLISANGFLNQYFLYYSNQSNQCFPPSAFITSLRFIWSHNYLTYWKF